AVAAGRGILLCSFGVRGRNTFATLTGRGWRVRVDAGQLRRLAWIPMRLVLLAEQPVLFPEPGDFRNEYRCCDDAAPRGYVAHHRDVGSGRLDRPSAEHLRPANWKMGRE